MTKTKITGKYSTVWCSSYYLRCFFVSFFQLPLVQLSREITMDMPQDIMGLGYLMDDLTTKGKVTKNN